MDYRQNLLVLLSVLLCSSQGLAESSTEAALVQAPPETSTEAIPESTSQENVSDLRTMMNKLNHPILELTKTVIRIDEMNSRIMTRLDEMKIESVKRFEEINSTMMTRLHEMNSESVKRFEEINSTMMTRLDEMNSETVKRFEENNSTMFSLFDKLDKKILKNSDESLKKSQEMDNKLMKRLDEMNAETVNRFKEMDLRVKSLGVAPYGKEKQFVLFTNKWITWTEAYNECINRNMSLASIESEEEHNKVVSLLSTQSKYNQYFWLSGTDLGHTGRYVWKSTGRDVTYNKWMQGEPDNGDNSNGEVDHCIMMWRNHLFWTDEACSAHNLYICQHWV